MRAFLIWLTARLAPPRVIYDREGISPYLSRWYLLAAKPEADAELKGQVVFKDTWLSRLPFNVYLHRFHRSDDDGELHSHPWAWALSIVLVGGYREERRVVDSVISRVVNPWRINWLTYYDYHRVDLIERDAWSLFIVGRKVDSWFFWNRITKRRVHWRNFVKAARGLVPESQWIADERARRPFPNAPPPPPRVQS